MSKSKTEPKSVVATGGSNQSPVLFNLGNLAPLFFDDKGIKKLINQRELTVDGSKTAEGYKALIYIKLSKDSNGYELNFVNYTTVGIESVTIFDTLDHFNHIDIKLWLYKILCDREYKTDFMKQLPDYYSFDSLHTLAV
jgi:hypothetical protein